MDRGEDIRDRGSWSMLHWNFNLKTNLMLVIEGILTMHISPCCCHFRDVINFKQVNLPPNRRYVTFRNGARPTRTGDMH